MSRCSTPAACAAARRVGDPDADVAHLRRAHRPAAVQRIVQRARRAQLHHQVGPPVGQCARVIDVDDMRVAGEPSRRRHFPDEPLHAVPLAEQHPVVHLDGHLAADRPLPAPVDGGEPARGPECPDLVPGDVRCGDSWCASLVAVARPGWTVGKPAPDNRCQRWCRARPRAGRMTGKVCDGRAQAGGGRGRGRPGPRAAGTDRPAFCPLCR